MQKVKSATVVFGLPITKTYPIVYCDITLK